MIPEGSVVLKSVGMSPTRVGDMIFSPMVRKPNGMSSAI
jgi:hypothetical protein